MVLLIGQGGSGKSEFLDIVKQLCIYFFGEDAYLVMASSNTAARVVGGDTIHSTCGLWGGDQPLTTANLAKSVTAKGKDKWQSLVCLVIDEVGLCPPDLFGAASFRGCLHRSDGDPNLFTKKGYAFGGVRLIVLTGDFLQLTPMVKIGRAMCRMSLLQAVKADLPVQYHDGVRCFKEIITQVVELKETYRFVDEHTKEKCTVLPALFEYMRKPCGKSMPALLWKALTKCVVKDPSDSRLRAPRMKAGYEMAIAWEAVGRLMAFRVFREAAEAKQLLIYIQAVDQPKHSLSPSEWEKLLSVVSLTTTGKRILFLGSSWACGCV